MPLNNTASLIGQFSGYLNNKKSSNHSSTTFELGLIVGISAVSLIACCCLCCCLCVLKGKLVVNNKFARNSLSKNTDTDDLEINKDTANENEARTVMLKLV